MCRRHGKLRIPSVDYLSYLSFRPIAYRTLRRGREKQQIISLIQGRIMAHNIFIKMEGIEGESQDSLHRGEIEVLRWRWSVGQPGNMHLGSGGGAGKCTIEALQFEHYLDKSSPNLLQHCLTGKHIPEAILTVSKSGGSPLEYIRITLQEIIITRVNLVYFDTMRVPREAISLAFSRINMDYFLQNAEGNKARAISIGYDIKGNSFA